MGKPPAMSFAALDLPPREATAVVVARRLLDYLQSGQVDAGQRIPSERQLALMLDVGRSTVREAVQALALIGLVEVRQGDGTYYLGAGTGLPTNPTEWSILLGARPTAQVIEARDQLAILVAGLAAAMRDPDVLGQLQTLADDLDADDGESGRVAVAASFRLLLASAGGNDILRQIVSTVEAMADGGAEADRGGDLPHRGQAAYQAVVDGIARRDVAAARSAMEAIVADGASDRVREPPPTNP